MYQHEDIRTGINIVGVDESYLEKALKRKGFSEFPKSGLNEGYLEPLMNEVFGMYAKESRLTPVKQKRKSLERKTEENREDIKKRALKLGEIGLGITGLFLTFPTMRRTMKDDGIKLWVPLLGGIVENYQLYRCLSQTNPKLVPYVLATQIATNLISGFYEVARHVKNKAKERTEI